MSPSCTYNLTDTPVIVNTAIHADWNKITVCQGTAILSEEQLDSTESWAHTKTPPSILRTNCTSGPQENTSLHSADQLHAGPTRKHLPPFCGQTARRAHRKTPPSILRTNCTLGPQENTSLHSADQLHAGPTGKHLPPFCRPAASWAHRKTPPSILRTNSKLGPQENTSLHSEDQLHTGPTGKRFPPFYGPTAAACEGNMCRLPR